MKKRSNSGGRCDRPILEHRAMTGNCNLHQQHQHLEHRAMTRICISLILHQPPSSFATAQMSIYEQNCGMLMGGCMYRNYYWPQPEESISVALTTSNQTCLFARQLCLARFSSTILSLSHTTSNLSLCSG